MLRRVLQGACGSCGPTSVDPAKMRSPCVECNMLSTSPLRAWSEHRETVAPLLVCLFPEGKYRKSSVLSAENIPEPTWSSRKLPYALMCVDQSIHLSSCLKELRSVSASDLPGYWALAHTSSGTERMSPSNYGVIRVASPTHSL